MVSKQWSLVLNFHRSVYAEPYKLILGVVISSEFGFNSLRDYINNISHYDFFKGKSL